MIDIERILAIAVCRRLQNIMGNAVSFPVNPDHIRVELDDTFPAMTAERAISVIPSGVEGLSYTVGMHDLSPRVKVFCMWRLRAVPRDRRRESYLENYRGLSAMLDGVYDCVHNYYFGPMINEIVKELKLFKFHGCQMVEPLRFVQLEGQHKIIYPPDFGSNQSQPAGIGRSIIFGRARYVST